MNIIKTGWRAYVAVFALVLFLVVLFALLDAFEFNNFGGSFIAHVIMVLFMHFTILDGKQKMFARDDKTKSIFSLGTIALTAGLLLLPVPFAAAAFFVVPGMSAMSTLLAGGAYLLVLWVVLACLGQRIPRRLVTALQPGMGEPLKANASGFVAFWLLVVNLPFLVLVSLFVYLLVIWQPQGLLLYGSTFVMELVTYMPSAFSAAVLSHAFLRTNNLPPQGLIEKL